MKTLTILLAILLLAVPIVAQDEPQDGAARAEYDKIIAEMTAEQDAYRAAVQKVSATEEYQKLLVAYRATKDQEERTIIGRKLNALRADIKRVDTAVYRERIKAGAEQYAGTEAAVPWLVWLVTRGGKALAAGAIPPLVESHLGSPEIGRFLDYLPYLTRQGLSQEEVRGIAAKAIEQAATHELRAAAHYSRARTFLASGRDPEPLPEFAEQYAADIAAVSELAPGSLLALRAEAPGFERTRLQIGMVAPEIEGTDLDGVEFKLSRYRGKVVVIDFWGDW